METSDHKDGRIEDTRLNVVADSAEEARYSVASLLGLYYERESVSEGIRVVVERVPANHNFAGSLDLILQREQVRMMRQKGKGG